MPNYMNPYYNQMQQPMQPQMMQPQAETLIPVRSDDEVLKYPVAPGNSVSFRNVAEPFIYTKTLTSQFSQPVVEKYRLVKETAQETKPTEYALKSDVEALAAQVAKLLKVDADE